jgi:hypothetical protein
MDLLKSKSKSPLLVPNTFIQLVLFVLEMNNIATYLFRSTVV